MYGSSTLSVLSTLGAHSPVPYCLHWLHLETTHLVVGQLADEANLVVCTVPVMVGPDLVGRIQRICDVGMIQRIYDVGRIQRMYDVGRFHVPDSEGSECSTSEQAKQCSNAWSWKTEHCMHCAALTALGTHC
jgi:hypothetical protein